MFGRMIATCSLCLQKKELQASHVVPRFVGKYLKSTSATGFMTGTRAEERVQDFPTLPLLCPECEQRFSKLEAYFANEIFFPFHEKNVRDFQYDARLQAFVVSLSWRTLKATYEDMSQEAPDLLSFVDEAESKWRQFLLGEKSDVEPYENHVVFLGSKIPGQVLPKFEWYAGRTVDATLAGNDVVFAFTKFPSMIFVSSIHPTRLKGWKGTLLKNEGRISTDQMVEDTEFWNFLGTRAAFIEAVVSGRLSESIEERVMRAMLNDPQRMLESESFKTMVLERDRIREERLKQMPEHVREIVNVITNAVDDPAKTKLENRLDVLRARTIADALCDLPTSESSELDTKILATLTISAKYDRDAQTTMEAKSIWVTFMSNPHVERDEQRSKIGAEISRLEAKQGSANAPIVVVSMSLTEDGVNFETGLLLTDQFTQSVSAPKESKTLSE